LYLGDQLPAATSNTDGVIYTKVGDIENQLAPTLQDLYQSEILGAYGNAYDISQRQTPLAMVSPKTQFEDLKDRIGEVTHIEIDNYPTSSLSLTEIYIQEPGEASVARTAANRGAGGPVGVQTVGPRSLPPGVRVGPAMNGLLPKRFTRPRPGVPTAAGPQHAAAVVQQSNAVTRGAALLMGNRKG
jgi:hypothetical protein